MLYCVKITSVGADLGVGFDTEGGGAGDDWAIGIDDSVQEFVIGSGDTRVYYANREFKLNTSGILTLSGGLAYTPAVSGNWDGAITKVRQALDELASRVEALETP